MKMVTRGTAIVTGASSGIGAATARRLSADGFALILVGRDTKRLATVGQSLVGPHTNVQVDLTQPDAPDKVVAALNHPAVAGQPLQALVNNAAVFHRLSFSQTTETMWREELETNLLAPVRLIRAALANFVEGGVILNVSSTLGIRPVANTVAYSAVKAALNNLTLGLALELAPRLRVCGVCPGLIDTPIHPFHKDTDDSEQRRQAHSAQPMRRMGQPEEIAAMISFLVGPESTWTTGSLHVVDGGISLL
jgi:NAD(P)-dependent dehydrogenase (short-subunit alcohol dehydrogenase family)